ncbi:MAG: DUF1800 domain-containing protein [Pseudomonadota bacterium]
MKNIETFHALNRFGLGAAPGEAKTLGNDPRGWVKAQIVRHPVPEVFSWFSSSAEIIAAIHNARLAGPDELRQATGDAYRKGFIPEVVARARVMIGSDSPFAERMVMFWSNHFTVSNAKRIIGPAIPAYEREAIRPHVFGKFADMLKAVSRHPAMISYLDNFASMGENSLAGVRRKAKTGTEKTLNENLAREILELHTLGVNGGYQQVDVIELAKAITGWSHGGARLPFERQPVHGNFEYKHFFHEPGPKTVLGKTYRENGDQEGLDILEDLALHPATAEFLATKLVRHFVADDPSGAAVDAIASVYRDSGGDLAQVSRALVDLEQAWASPLAKVKSHYEYVVAVHRATGHRQAKALDVLQPLRDMGQLPFSATSPAGWGDEAKDWIAPEALMRRIEWIHRYTANLSSGLDPLAELDDLMGPVVNDATRVTVQRAPTRKDAMALILASAEFQRR